MSRLTDARAQQQSQLVVEERFNTVASSPYGWGMTDPSAIPPPNMRTNMRAGIPVDLHTTLTVDAVWAAERAISTPLLKLGDPLPYEMAYTDEFVGYKQLLDPGKYPLLQNTFSNGWQHEGLRQTIISMMLMGEVFWIQLRDGRGRTLAVEVLHPGFMEVKKDEDDNPVYLYGVGTNRQELNAADVIHTKFISLPQSTRGLNSIEYGSLNVGLILASLDFGSRFFSQGMAPNYALTTDSNPSQEQMDALVSSMVNKHAGLPNAHLPLLLTNGMKAEKIMATPDEAQYNSTLSTARNAVAAWYGVPLWLMSSTDPRSGSLAVGTAEELSKIFKQYTLAGYLVVLDALYSKLVPAGVSAAFDSGKLTHPDAQSQADYVTAMRSSQAFTIDDVRTRIAGLPPLPNSEGEGLSPLASNMAPGQDVPKPTPDPDPEDDSEDRSRTGRALEIIEREQSHSDAVLEAQERRHQEQLATFAKGQADILEAIKGMPAPQIDVHVETPLTRTKVIRDKEGRAIGAEQELVK